MYGVGSWIRVGAVLICAAGCGEVVSTASDAAVTDEDGGTGGRDGGGDTADADPTPALTVELTGEGAGTVDYGFGTCSTTCSVDVDPNTEITLSVSVGELSRFAGWSVEECGATDTCAITVTSDITVTATIDPLPNYAFVTSETLSVTSLGGLEGADATCNEQAAAAGLPGEYVAWLSTSDVAALDRLQGDGWIRPDGKPFADSAADLAEGTIYYPPRLDASGADVGESDQPPRAWTGALADGTASDDTCADWTSNAEADQALTGRADGTTGAWTQGFIRDCNEAHRIYCLGIDREAAGSLRPPLPPSGARLAFLAPFWPNPGEGLSGADSFCQEQADAAGFAGTFLAGLAGAEPAAARFDANGETWYRPDGVPIAATAERLLAGAWDAPINVTASGSYFQGDAWLGAPGFAAPPGENCSDWTTTSEDVQGLFGAASLTGEPLTGSTYLCSVQSSIRCLQQ